MKRQQVPPTDGWQQRQLLAKTSEQRTYDLIRPVVLFGQPPASAPRKRQRSTVTQPALFVLDPVGYARHSSMHGGVLSCLAIRPAPTS